MTGTATTWKLRYAPHIGLTSPDTPPFRHTLGSADPVEQVRFIAEQGFAGIEDNFLKLRPAAEQERIGVALARAGPARRRRDDLSASTSGR